MPNAELNMIKIVAYLIAALAIWMALKALYHVYLDLQMEWTETEARIIDFKIEGNVGGRPSGWSYLTVKYEYIVDGITFTSNVVYSDQVHGEVPEDFPARVGLFDRDRPVIIQYSAVDPSQARLATRGRGHYVGAFFFFALSIGFAALLDFLADGIQSIWTQALEKISE